MLPELLLFSRFDGQRSEIEGFGAFILFVRTEVPEVLGPGSVEALINFWHMFVGICISFSLDICFRRPTPPEGRHGVKG